MDPAKGPSAQASLVENSLPVRKVLSEKRKAQNRQAQRNYRQRMREIGLRIKSSPSSTNSNATPGSIPSTSPTSNSSSTNEVIAHPTPSTDSIASDSSSGSELQSNANSSDLTPWTLYATNKAHLHKLSRSNFNRMMNDLERFVRQSYQQPASPSPRADMLLNLIQFNVFRALVQNTASMGFTMGWLKETAISPWSTEEGSRIDLTKCPPSLRPTALQCMVSHHPWIDLFPHPKLRDNLLLADSYYDEDRLCNDVVEFCDVPNESTGLIVWGDPCNPASWEVSETFFRNWAWVINGCHEIQTSTNHWRRMRGETEIRFKDVSPD